MVGLTNSDGCPQPAVRLVHKGLAAIDVAARVETIRRGVASRDDERKELKRPQICASNLFRLCEASGEHRCRPRYGSHAKRIRRLAARCIEVVATASLESRQTVLAKACVGAASATG
jgi:predicted subunit of tRNA(5-methylaminomethyl-2-thiouridylate) methyltransferase